MLSDRSPNDVEKIPAAARRGTTFVVSREKFDEIPGYRGRYIVLYILFTLLLIAPKVVFVVTKVDPPYEFAPIFYTVLMGVYIPFCVYFFKAMRTLGYPLLWILLVLMVTSTPIIGLLPMGYMDRKIADAWDKADGEHERYRERVSEEEETE